MEIESQKALIAGLYNRCAPTFDQIGPKLFTIFGQQLVTLLDIKEGATVLDVATGRGANLFPAAERVGDRGWVVGIDLASVMVQETAREAATRGYDHVTVQQMDAEALRFADESFDHVLCGYAIFWFHDFHKALSEFYRVLTVGGQTGITMSSGQDSTWQWYHELLRSYDAQYSLDVDYGLPKRGINRDVVGLERAMGEVGFADVRTVTIDHKFFYTEAEEWWDALWTHGSRSPLEQMPDEVLARFKEECFRHLPQLATNKGYPFQQTTTYTLANKISVTIQQMGV
jgi:ubiquinone/menaquinone biosynthesis C-methylase UbiE